MSGEHDHLIGGAKIAPRSDAHPRLFAAGPQFSGAVRRHFPVLARRQRQSSAGSCTAHGASHALESDVLARTGAVVNVCRLDLYRGSRLVEGNGAETRDGGAYPDNVWRWLREYGTLSEVVAAYDPSLVTSWTPKPEWAADRLAFTADVRPIPVSADAILAELEKDRCVPMAHLVYRSIDEAGRTGVERGPDGGAVLGGHMRDFCGFDLDKTFAIAGLGTGALLVANSWAGWGIEHPLRATDSRFEFQDESFSWIPLSVLTARDFVMETARIARGLNVET